VKVDPTSLITTGPEFFINRELSWLAFNTRVLEEAANRATPLLERAKFAAIAASNLDEFFMVRVAGLKNAELEGEIAPDPAGLRPAEQLAAISERAHAMVEELQTLVTGELLPALEAHGIRLTSIAQLDDHTRAALGAYFRDQVLPVLTPLAIDFARPFPMLSSLSLNLAFSLKPEAEGEEHRLAIVQVPSRLSRLVRVPESSHPTFVLLEDLIRAQADQLFPGQTILESAAFRLARDSELELDDEGGLSYLEALEEELRKRRRSAIVRLEVEASVSDALLKLLTHEMPVHAEDIYRVSGLLDLRVLFGFVELSGYIDLRDPVIKPACVLSRRDETEIFSILDQRDVLLHHPYESFDPVVALVEAAADDPDVIAIKQTLYRTSGDSPIVAALTRAADQGKQVTALVELMARFDEERNIHWARRLEERGAHVIYGIRDYKVHAKICLVVRRTKTGLKRYLHLGTGNYNDKTARLYTDFGLLTAKQEFGADASALFSALTGYSDPPRLRKLAMAPTMLRDRVLKLIERETRRAKAGQPAEIRAKMNSLTDEDIIRALYQASRAGVRIKLNVRGICMLRPGVPGLSETISVVSIVGRYLEHARIFVFQNGGDQEVYLSSADWMTRNLDKRIELMFPIEDAAAAAKVVSALDVLLRDTVKGRRLHSNGEWRLPLPGPGITPFDAQMFLHEQAQRQSGEESGTSFVPIERPAGLVK
jgi:polyphosphate kinase